MCARAGQRTRGPYTAPPHVVIGQGQAHLRRVLAAAARLARPRRIVLFAHDAVARPAAMVGAQPAQRDLLRQHGASRGAAACEALDEHLLQRRPRVRPIPLLSARDEGGGDAPGLQQPAAAQRRHRRLRLRRRARARPQGREAGSRDLADEGLVPRISTYLLPQVVLTFACSARSLATGCTCGSCSPVSQSRSCQQPEASLHSQLSIALSLAAAAAS